jgi:hypothetical protein
MSSLDDFLEFTSPNEFGAGTPKGVRDRLKALTAELMHRFDHLWFRFLGELALAQPRRARQEYSTLRKHDFKILS